MFGRDNVINNLSQSKIKIKSAMRPSLIAKIESTQIIIFLFFTILAHYKLKL